MPIRIEPDSLIDLVESIKTASADSDKSFKLAMNGSRRKSKALTQTICAGEYNVSKDRIGKDLAVRAVNGYSYEITGRKRRRGPSLIEYGASQTSSGLAVTIRKDKGAKRIRSGFIRNGLSGNLLAFVRSGPARVMRLGRYEGQRRQPLKALSGPSVADMLNNETVFSGIQDNFFSTVSEELSNRLVRAIKKRG